MATLAVSVAGTSISISASLPATYDSTGFAALTYTTVAEVTDLAAYGKEFTLITHNPVGDRKTYKLKGSYNNGTMAVKMAQALSDAGQAILLAASDSDASYSFMITHQGGVKKDYFTAKAMSLKTNIGTVNNILSADVNLEVDSDIVRVTS